MPSALVTPIMALGSFVAGSTFLGGGAVAFPGLTKIMAVDPSSAKTFSLAIQSVGMTSASLYICFSVKNIPWRFFALYLPGVIIGLLVSLGFLEKVVAGNDLRIGFSLFVLIFMLIYLWAYTNKKAHYTDLGKLSIVDKNLIFKAGLLGGIISGLLGSGADLVAFCLLALYFRIDLKLATQTSVIIMALTSIVGVLLQGLVFADITPAIQQLWLLATPVVMIGAPLGAVFCRRATTRSLLFFISAIVIAELVSTLLLVPIALNRAGYYISLAVISVTLLLLLHKYNRRKTHTSQQACKELD
ncbi:sulfite exporter TauE/SafE family protein [Teredinibacter haidensis]|uniref:sulfite exporter TauE/SafE family protein n=1 Tax=Teredinibacter haidensis TaxID=2731755 RepID=UPI001FE5FE2C|nr:sulfite exporter TauE/SafE family protein [Teredinibacter haidensis]